MKQFLSLCCVAMSHFATFGQAGANDPTFNPGDVGFGQGDGANGSIDATESQADGKVIIAGNFNIYNGTNRNRIARLNADGSLDTSFNPGTGAIGRILDVSIQSDGKIIIGGDFNSYNGTIRNRIARVNVDGSLDASFNPVTGANHTVLTTAIQADGKVIIGGGLTSYDGVGRNRIARLNSDGTLDTSFEPGAGANGFVRSTSIQTDGKILIGGDFTSYNGTSRNRIARLNADGSLDASFNPGAGANFNVHSISFQADGKVIIGGRFTVYNGSVRSRIARLNVDGSLDSSFNPGTGASTTVNTTSIQTNGKIIIGGEFISYNGTIRNRIARLNADGSLDASFNPVIDVNHTVLTTSVQADGKIILGGYFTNYNGTSRNHIARLNADGSLDASFNPLTGANSFVYTTSLQSDGKIIIGGEFTCYNGTSRNKIARLNADGSLDASFNPVTGANYTVYATSIQTDGKIIIGGTFTSYDGTIRNRIARLNADGSLDASFNPGTGANHDILTISSQADGKIILGGYFTNYNGTSRNHIARLNADGSLDPSFDPGSGAQGTFYWPGLTGVQASSIQADGKIIIAGNFTHYNGTSRNGIARLNVDGTLDTSFNPGTGANDSVFSTAIQADGKIIIGGSFEYFSGTSRNKIARLNANGSLDASFNPGTGANTTVKTISIQADGKIIIGGSFEYFSGTSRKKVARLNANGSLDTSFNPGTGANSIVFSTSIQADGKIIIGGYFVSYADVGRNRIARVHSAPPPDCNGVPGGTAYLDDCNTCVGGTTGLTPCDPDCNGVPGGTAYLDECDVCVGGNTGLLPCPDDCNGDPGGTALFDNCGTCVGGNTGQTACVQDCNGVWGGTAMVDPNCGLCHGGTTGVGPCVQDCNNEWGGTAFVDNCAQCVGGSTGLEACEQDCTGQWGGTATVDPCGECTGGDTGIPSCIPVVGDYISQTSGNWSTPGTWLRYDGTEYVVATTPPNSGSGSITIRSGHLIQLNSNNAADQLLVKEGGILHISGGTFTVADGAGIDLMCAGSLTLNGSAATLVVNGTFTVGTGHFQWTNGGVSGTGSIGIGDQGTAAIAGANNKTLGIPLTNNGAAIWSGGDISGSGTIVNGSTGVMEITFSSLSGLQVPFSNSGIVNYTGTGSFYTTAGTFTNTSTGALNVNNGVWSFNSTLVNAGNLHIAATKVMIMNSAVSLDPGTAISGNGEFRVSGGTTTLNTSVTNSTNHFWWYQGVINMTMGNALFLEDGSSLLWSTTTLNGLGGLHIGIAVPVTLDGSGRSANTVVFNQGIITWNSGDMTGSGYIENLAAGVVNVGFSSLSGLQVNLTNWGAVNYTGTSSFYTVAPAIFSNRATGTLNVNNGVWSFNNNMVNYGTLHIAAGKVMIMNAPVTLHAGTSITGTGEFRISGGTTTLNTPLNNATNSFWFYQGTLSTTTDHAFSLHAGSSMLWHTTSLSGAGGINIGSGVQAQITGTSTHPLNTTLTNSGTITWSGGDLSGSGSLQNQAGGVVDITFSSLSGLQVPFTNSGTVNYSGTSSFYAVAPSVFTNASTGVFNVNNGVWQFENGLINAGTLHIAASRVMIMNSMVSLNTGTSITGTGEFRISGGTTTLNAPLTNSSNHFWFYQGTFNTTPGSALSLQAGSSMLWHTNNLSGAGGINIGSGATLQAAAGGTHPLNTPLTNSGTMTWSGSPISGSGTITNMATGALDITFTSPFGSDLNVAISNAGTLNYTGAGSHSTNSGTPTFTNTGTFNINGGGWYFSSSPFVTSGVVEVAAGCSLNIYGTPPALGGTVVNNGTVNGGISGFTGPTFTNNGNVTLANLPFTGSLSQTLDGTGSINTLTIDNANGVSLGGTQTINTSLALTNGKLTLGNNSLLLGPGAALTGGSASSYCVAEGTGVLRRRVANNATNVLYPVGLVASYLPVNVQLTAGSTADDFSVRVQDDLSDEYDGADEPIGGALTQHVVPRAWIIDEAVAGGSDATIQLQWNGADEGPLFNRTACSVIRYDGADWTTSMFGSSSGSGPYTRSLSGITAFSPFSVADDLAPLTAGIQLAVRAFLEGPFDNATNRMGDALRSGGLIPLSEPHTALGYTHVGGGGEVTSAPVLALTGDNAIVDWVVIELRDAVIPSTVLASQSALVQRDGDVVAVDGFSSLAFTQPAGNYHVAIRHRNHLGCMTLNAVALGPSPVTVEFTSAATTTFGSGARKTSTGAIAVQLLWAGNVTFNNDVKYTGAGNDRDPILVTVGSTTPNNTVNAYSTRDVNMDGTVKYTGSGNDRDPILVNVGSTTPNNIRTEQLP